MAEIVDPFKKNPSQPNTKGIVDPFAGPSPAAIEVDKSKQIERSWGQALGDTALGVAAGAANLVGGLVETREATKPTNIARQGLRLLDRAGVPGASSLAAKVPRTLTERQFGMAPGAGSAATSKGIQMMSGAIGGAQSDALQQEKQELAETEGFVGSAKKVLTSPRLLGNFVAEQVPNIATMGVGTRLAAARAGQRALGGALAKGLGMEAAETAAAAAGKKAATTAATSMTTVMEAGQAGQQTYQQAMAQPQSVWDANPEYQRMIAAGADPVTAKETIARGASLQAQAITAPIAAVAGRFAAPFEADVFTRQLARRPMAMLQGAARETVEEMIQEGGSQFSGNVAQRQVDPNQGVWEGVPEAAGIGAALGAVLGGGMSAGGALASERRGATAESDRGLPPNAPQDDLLALPAPAPTVVSPDGTAPTAPGAPFAVDADGVAVTPQQAFDADGARLREGQERQAADIAFSQQRSDMGLTPDVNRARARHPAAAPALPDGSPIPDPARGVLSRAVNIGIANGAVQRAAEEQAIAQAEAVAEHERKAGDQKAARQPDMFDMDPATGEVVVPPPAPREDDLRGRLDYLRQQAKRSGWSQRLVEERRTVERDLRAITDKAARQEAPAVESPASAGPVTAVQAAETPVGSAMSAAAEMSAYDTSGEMLDADIGAPSGGPFTIEDAAQRVAARTDGGQVFPVDGGFVVRTPQAAAAPVPTATAPSVSTGVVDAAAAEAATSPANDRPEPTDAQKEAGNYKKGHTRVAGLDISIENPAGSRRRPEWPPLQSHYGYFKGTTGADKDHVDVFLTDRAEDDSLPVFVVDQVNRDGSFDEHKVVMGAPDEASARATYLSNYEQGWQGLGGITQMTQDEFRTWVKDPTKTVKPAAQTPTETAAPALPAVQDQPPTAGNEGLGAQPTNPVHSALRRIAGGEHPELTLSGMDAGDIRAVGEAMGRKFSPRASSAAIAERLGEVARTDWMAAARRAVEKLPVGAITGGGPAQPVNAENLGQSKPTVSGEFPLKEAADSYSGISHSGTSRAKADAGEFEAYIDTARDAGTEVARSNVQKDAVAQAVDALRADYLVQYRRLMGVRAGTYSGFVAGRSGLNSKQADKRSSAYDRAIDTFVAWQKANQGRVRQAALDARTEEEKTADRQAAEQNRAEKAQRKEDSDRRLMRKILSWQKGGDPVAITKTAHLAGVNFGSDGYPTSIKLAPTDGSVLTDDKFDLAALFRPRDASVPESKRRVRELVDAVKAEDTELERLKTPAEEATAPAAPPTSKTPMLDQHVELMNRAREGKATPAEFQRAFAAVADGKDALVAELSGMAKDKLLDTGGGYFASRYKGERKDKVVDALAELVLAEFALGRSYGLTSYVLTANGMAEQQRAKDAALRELVANTTEADLKAFADEVAQARAEVAGRKEAQAKTLADPQTLADFQAVMRHHIAQGASYQDAYLQLTPEQRQRYDALAAESTRESRERGKADRRPQVAAARQATTGQVVETKHTRDGYDLFVVQLGERVSREDYDTLNTSAKRMGGWYSKFRGNGAVPGFQFKTREAAEAFSKLVAGDAADAVVVADARRDAFADDRSQSAVERLRSMADALAERADEALSRDRKANTTRRARMAAGAEAAARADKALAGTMRNLADAIKAGDAKFLDAVRQKVQVELLAAELRTAKDAQVRAKYSTYAEQEKHRGEPVDAETVDFAIFPTYGAMRSDLAGIARQMLDVDGLKKLGAKLASVADDVTGAYTDWAKQNLLQVSRFGRAGELAEFRSRDDAERAIRRAGLTGRAIVLPIKRGQNRVVLAPSEAMKLGIWEGDGDKRITLSSDFGKELVDAVGRRAGQKIRLPWGLERTHEKRKRLEGMGIFTAPEYRSALREFAALQEAIATPNKIKEMERSMVGRRNDGLDFFPTSAEVVDTVLAAAEIEPGMAVLEPSAGMGHIADAIRDKAGVDPDVVELSGERRELLEAKGYQLVGDDFLALKPRNGFTYGDVFRHKDGTLGVMRGSGGMGSGRVGFQPLDANGQPDTRIARWEDREDLTGVEHRGADSGYDRIVMNPPFSKGRDITHVRHAYDLLRPGGRLVAIIGEGAFFHSNKNAESFRTWLDDLGATSERLPEGSFMDPALPVNTGVNARLVVIEKPAGSDLRFSKPDTDQAEIPAFRRWFGDSKVVDGRGRPLVAYHGTTADFTRFSTEFLGTGDGRADWGDGFYFASNPAAANGYAEGEGGNVMPVYLRITNPADADVMARPEVQDVIDDGMGFEELGDVLGRMGYDGIAIDHGADGQEFIVFRPEQIKSATGNAGTFDPRNPDIRFSRRDTGGSAGLSIEQVRKATDRVTAGWRGDAPKVQVVQRAAELPARARVDPDHATAEGFYDEADGTVYLVADNLRSPRRALQVLAHEAVGHYGIEAITGPELWGQVRQAIEKMRASGQHAELFAEIDRRYRGVNRDIAVREALAVMAERGISGSVIDRVVAAVRRFLRQLGFRVEFSEAELRQHLAAAARYVRGGSRPRLAAAASNADLAFSRTDIDPDRAVPVVSLAGGIFGDTTRDAAGARRRARDYLKKLRDTGNLMTNDDTGWKIGLSGKGINELASWNPAKLNLIAALPRITRIAVLARTEANAEVSTANPAGESVLAYHTFYAPVRMNGELRLARLVVQEQKGGRYAYDLQQSGLVEERSPAEPARIPGHIRGASQTQAGLTDMTVAQLRDAVNAVDRPGWKWSKADSAAGDAFARWFGGSQVVTGDGQPKVVYHGTADGFWSFDKGRLSESTGHMSAPLGFFFAEDRVSAEGYARLAADGVPADERVVDAFLSIQHPFRMTVADLMQIESKDEAAALRMVMQRQGYDGIHVTDAGKGQWIAFEPEQIKSATENVGTFDRASSDLRFSNPDPTAVIDAIDERGRGVGEGIAARLKDMFRGLKPENLRENTRPAWLGALTLRHLAELGGDLKLRQVGEYADLVQRMATARNVMQETVSGTADSWEKFQRKDRAGADATANLMHDTTIEGVDPSKDYEPLRTGTTKRGPDEAVTRESIARRKAAVVQEMAQAGSPAARARLDAEAKRLDELLAQEQRRRDQYPALVRRFLALPDAGQKLYREVRDAYEKQSERMEDALVARIDALEIDGKQKAAMVAQVRQHFESARVNGPYFPLQRFGQFWISAESPAGEPAFMMYERVESWREAQRELQARGFKIKNAGRKLDEARGLAGASGGFMADLQGLLETSGVDKDTRDEVYQLYLRTLPDLSVRKHQIHRKATAGYSNDALRAFSSNMFHGSFQVARLRHSHELDAALLDMKAAVETMTGSDPERAAKAAALYSEMNKRHEWVMNPRDSKGVSSLTSIGFAWYLGATPAAALVNLTQTAIVSYPVLAARFGAGKAFTMLSSATGQALRNATGDITRSLTQEERAAYQLWREAGTIDKSQAHNLAGLSETDTRAFNPWARRAMEVISWGFHRTEVVNREATALAAFRLARESGQSFNDAVKYAGEVVTESHFDYSNANRARWMQSNAAKVLLLFRQYSLNMTWFLWRNLYQSLKGEAPEVRKEARAKLAGVLGMTGVFAGAMGMPLMSVMFGLAEAAAAAFGDDDDEPFDAEVAFRNFLADMLGPDVARILAKGPADYFTGANISGRVSLNDLWLREPNRELEGQAQADYLLEQAAGPLFGGMLVNTLRGMKQIGDGHTWRGIETMMPKSIKDGMKSVRYATHGVNTLKGDPVIDDLGVGGALLQLAGFSPASLSERYDGINAAKNYEEKLLGRRSALLNAYAMAWRAGDADTVGKVLEKMRAFNQAQPALAINSETIRQSLQARLRYSSRAEGGVVLNPKVAAQAREQARFAE